MTEELTEAADRSKGSFWLTVEGTQSSLAWALVAAIAWSVAAGPCGMACSCCCHQEVKG